MCCRRCTFALYIAEVGYTVRVHTSARRFCATRLVAERDEDVEGLEDPEEAMETEEGEAAAAGQQGERRADGEDDSGGDSGDDSGDGEARG